jgi:HlyD family secretion protein
MKKRLRWLAPVVVVAIAVLILGLRALRPDSRAVAGEQPPAAADGRRAKAEIGDVSVHLSETGLIQPKTMVLVKSKVSGKITRLDVREGDSVRQGARLATVEPDMAQARTVASLKSEYGRARVDLERARQDCARDLELHKQGHISDTQLKLTQDAYDIAKIEYQSALEQMQLAEEDGVRMDLAGENGARTNLAGESGGRLDLDAQSTKLLDIMAPASGTIINMEIEEGEIVTSGAVSYTSGTTLMTIADLSIMQIKAGVNEVDIGKVRLGQDVKIDVDAYPGVTFHGVITHVAPAARDEQGVKIDITNSDERLRPNMTANIEIQGDHREGVLTIPIEAAFRKQGRYVAYVFDGSPGEPVEREITTGVANIEKIEVVAGLTEGDLVARYDPEIEGRATDEDAVRRQRMAANARRR